MTDDDSSIERQFLKAATAIHLDEAALHLYEACREWSKVVLPHFYDRSVTDMRLDAIYRAKGAHRRGINSVRMVTIEVIAATLAEADGQDWPICGRGISLDIEGTELEAIKATRRQRYRHVAIKVVADVFRYTELGDDTESQRLRRLEDSRQQRANDAVTVSTWRTWRESLRLRFAGTKGGN